MSIRTLVVVTTTRNEARNAALVISEASTAAEALMADGWRFSLLVVDDSSSDLTRDTIEHEAKLRDLDVEVVQGPGRGISQASMVGLSKAVGREPTLIATLDFDGQHDATQLPTLVDLWEQSGKLDVVFGSRFRAGSEVTGVSGFRKLISKLAQRAIRVATAGPAIPSDSTTSLRVFTPRVAEAFLADVPAAGLDGYRLFSWFAVFTSCHYSFGEVPIVFRPRLNGVSKLTFRDLVGFMSGLRQMRQSSKDWCRQARQAEIFPEYPNQYLEDLGDLPRYNEWIVSTFRDSLHGRVADVGAGMGTFTEAFARLPAVASVVALEPDPKRHAVLVEATRGQTMIEPVLGTTATVEGPFDTVLYCNSLEHIEGVLAELRRASQLCKPGGTLVVFGPAMELIYGELDRMSGHFRRFNLKQLGRVIDEAGFDVLSARYHDPIGGVLYGISNRLLRSGELRTGLLPVYERVILPISSALTPLTSRLMGKNVVIIARRR